MNQKLKHLLCNLLTLVIICVTIAVPSTAATDLTKQTLTNYSSEFSEGLIESYAIPGIPSMIPQGFTKFTYNNVNYFAISAYSSTSGVSSKLYILKADTGTLVKTFTLPTTSHVGGVHITTENLFVADSTNKRLGRISLATLMGTKTSLSSFEYTYALNHTASYVTKYDGVYWVGCWVEGATSTKLYGYDSLSTSGTNTPDYTVTVPANIQGITFLGSTTTFALSQSYGRHNKSTILTYTNTSLTSSSTTNITSKSPTKTIVPCMLEETVYYGGNLYLLFESATNKYYYDTTDKATYPMDHLCTIAKSKL